jgi:type IV secretion system protein VirD4
MTTTTPRATGTDPIAYIVLAGAALVLAGDGAMYAASRIIGHRPTPGSPTALLSALQHGYRPATAVLVLAAGYFSVMLLAAFALVWRWTGRRKHGSSTPARWANRKDLATLIVGKNPPTRRGRIGLGQTDPGGQLLAAEPKHSVCVLGPAGSGKTCSVVIPTLLDWDGPAVVTSVKTDVLDATVNRRDGLGPVLIYDPTGSTGRPSDELATWNPLAACRTWADAHEMAGWLVDAAAPNDGQRGEPFWTSKGRQLLAPLLFAAGTGGLGMADVVRWAQLQEVDDVEDRLKDQGVVEALNAFRAVRKYPANTAGSIYATVDSILEVFGDPTVAASADGCDIDPAALLDSCGTIFLVSPVHAQIRLAPLIEALIMSIVREAQNRSQAGKPCDPGLLLLLDEAGNVAPLRHLPAIASTGRGQGIQLVTAWQDLGQIKHRYGQLAGTVLTNHAGLLALRGIRDRETLDLLSFLLGDGEVDRTSTTQQAGGGQAVSTSRQRERLAPADALRQLSVGSGLLIYGSLPPVRVQFKILPIRLDL